MDTNEQALDEPDEKIENGTHNYSAESDYVPTTNKKVLEQLEWFKDQKLGLMMHWGPYSQLGLVESWALSDQDADWSRKGVDWDVNAEQFKQQYFDLNKTFNPVRFQPDKWAEIAAEGGFRYLTFTTKHHDGFCMWDTKYSDYKITANDCPFHTNKNADICKNLFEAFRRKGLGISAYFSKADWHSPYYWAKGKSRGNFTWRGPSYNPVDEPELWEKFVQFTQNQVKELCTEYGKIDVLWFDAGWVCPQSPTHQDIRLGEMIDEIRKFQPWILSADRTVGGEYENVVTPEQCVPEAPLSIPWESNITIGTSFSFAYEDDYKSPRKLVNILVDVVAKGGNLVFNVGPQPDGRIPRGAVKSILGLGEWLKVYGEAIYGTRVCAPFKKGNIAFTKKDSKVYAIVLYEDENQSVDSKIFVPYTGAVMAVSMLGSDETVSYETNGKGIEITLKGERTDKKPIAQVFVISVS